MPTFADTDAATIEAGIVADLIEKYSLTEIPTEHLQDLWDGVLLLAVNHDGSFFIGETVVNESTARTYRYEHVYMFGFGGVVERRYAITESMANGGFESKATVSFPSPGTKFYR